MKATPRMITLLTAMVFISVGCAAIMSGKTQALSFNSSPDSADVLINGMKVGTTPLMVEVRRKEGTIVTFRKNGYQEATQQLGSNSNPWLIGNLIWSWLSTVGTTVDYVLDTNIEYSPNTYFMTLKPLDPKQQSFYDQQNKVAHFVLKNYDGLGKDLSVRQGEHLNALFSLLNLSIEKQPTATSELNALFFKKRDPARFLLAVIEKFCNRPDDNA